MVTRLFRHHFSIISEVKRPKRKADAIGISLEDLRLAVISSDSLGLKPNQED
jgi:hypothetical protein